MRTPRTAPTGTTNISTNWGTSSGFDGQEDFEGPQDISDVVGFETEIPRGSRPTPSLPSAPSRPSGGGGIDLSKPGPTPFEGMEPKRAPGRAPIGLEIGKSAGGGLGIGVSIPLGGPISARGGVNIGAGGAIKGAQVGLGLGVGPIGAAIDVGIDQDEQGRAGCYQYVIVSLGPFSHTYGRNVCEPTPSPSPSPSPSPKPTIPTSVKCLTGSWVVGGYGARATGNENEFLEGLAYLQHLTIGMKNNLDYYTTGWDELAASTHANIIWGAGKWKKEEIEATGYHPFPISPTPSPTVAYVGEWYYQRTNGVIFYGGDRRNQYGKFWMKGVWTATLPKYKANNNSGEFYGATYNWRSIVVEVLPAPPCPPETPTPTPTPTPIPSPNFSLPPNPPPRKRMNNECCQILALYHQEQLRLMGRPLGSQGQLIPIPPGTFFETETERIKTPINNTADPQKEKIRFNNFYELLMYGLKQQIDLDVAVDPQSFVVPTGKLQNPSYERDSEQSLENNTQPDTDKKGNKRELEIGEDIQINSIVQQQQYLFAVAKRLEYLFPSGELGDARFKKSLIIPGAEGELKIHNLIHFKEFLIQFLNATLGNPKIPIKIEDTNVIKEGNQEAIFNHFSISHMIRELYKIVLESGDDINAIMETTVRDFRTNLANRIQIVQIAEMCQALIQDTGMLEAQEFIPVKLDGDPYAGKWKPGMGFEPDADLDSNEEKATEKLMKATLKNFQAQVKVIRRDGRENADIRDLLLQLAEMFTRSTSIPATKEGIEKALAAAKFKVKVDNALSRTQVKRAAAAKLSRTKKRNK